MEQIRLHKGLDILVKGEAKKVVCKTLVPKVVAVRPSDFKNVVPKLLVREGDTVKAGQPVFGDKARPQITFASPVSGTVKAVVRGEKRKLLAVEIASDGKNESVQFEPVSTSAGKDEIAAKLLASGLWASIIQRPYGIIANPADTPKAIVISAFNSAPLAADISLTVKDEVENIQAAVDALAKFTSGKVYVNISAGDENSPLANLKGVVITKFKGPHPAGNVGIQIAHLCPIGKGDVVWTVKPQDLVVIGRLLKKGVYDPSRIVAVAGSRVKNPAYVKCVPGASVKELTDGFDIKAQKEIYDQECGVRYISGNILSGENVGENGYLGYYDDTLSIITEGNYRELFGWAKIIRSKKFSLSKSYFSWLMPKKKYNVDTNLNGGVRPFVVTGLYEKVLPMDIYPVYLLKAIITEDIEKMEQLGIYEVVGEDLALCEYVCPSKVNVQEIIEQGISLMLKEMA
ncbi:MAG: Na(+)-translocating NADH-quinone reductase subunit A [Candidatus Egerieousia sp.]